MDVDWDKIEDHYKEVPVAVSNSPQFSESTKVNINATSSSNIRQYSPNLLSATVESDTNFSHLSNKSPDTAINVVKPSVSLIGDYATVKPDAK